MPRVLARVVVVATMCAVPALAVADPIATLTVDNTTYNIDVSRLDDKRWQFGKADPTGKPVWELLVPGQFSVTLTGVLDPDPSIAYGLAVIDFGAPSTFGFSFGTPIVSTSAPNVVASSLGGTLTDGRDNGITLTPTGAAVQTASVGNPLTTMGVDIGLAASHGPSTVGASYAYGPYAAGPVAGPGPGPWTLLVVTAGFTLSGDGDMATLTGSASINPGTLNVPEPGLFALLGLGLVAVARRTPRRVRAR